MFLVNWQLISNREDENVESAWPRYTHLFKEWNKVSLALVEKDISEMYEVEPEDFKWEIETLDKVAWLYSGFIREEAEPWVQIGVFKVEAI